MVTDKTKIPNLLLSLFSSVVLGYDWVTMGNNRPLIIPIFRIERSVIHLYPRVV